jgi:hypothetical protein
MACAISKKGQAGVIKVLYIAAMACHLEKYLRTAAPQQPVSLTIALPLPSLLFWRLILFCSSHVFQHQYEGVQFTIIEASIFPKFSVAFSAFRCSKPAFANLYFCTLGPRGSFRA